MKQVDAEAESYLNTRDRVRIWRAFSAMRYAGGLGITQRRHDEMTVDSVLEALEQLSVRLVDAAETSQAEQAKLAEHRQMFRAIGSLLDQIAATRS